jgi:Zn-finger nucleic acid-binding protein
MLMLIEKGVPLWYCEECAGSWFDDSEIAFGHDCEVSND